MTEFHPSVQQILNHFRDEADSGIPMVSGMLRDVAYEMANYLNQNPELTTGLRKLLEAKDCFNRAGITIEG